MATATQAAQPHWMTPLVLVTPRLEQELRFDFYDQQNGTGSQGNGQHLYNYGGPGGIRAEFIPTYLHRSNFGGPVDGERLGPEGAWTRRRRLAGVSCERPVLFRERGERQLYPERLLSDVGSRWLRPGRSRTTFWLLSRRLAGGKGWGDFDIEMTISQQYPVAAHTDSASSGHHVAQFRRPGPVEHGLSISFLAVFLAGTGGQLRILAERRAFRV